MSKVSVKSEIGKLEKVIVHKPGHEIELMTPDTAVDLLFDDILDLHTAAREHDEFTNILKLHSKVFEINDLLVDLLKNETHRERLIKSLISERIEKSQSEISATGVECIHAIPTKDIPPKFNVLQTAEGNSASYSASYISLEPPLTKGGTSALSMMESQMDALMQLDENDLAEMLIIGSENGTYSKKNKSFKPDYFFPPLPNLFYTRDTSVVINNYVLSGIMANSIRFSEATIMRYILRNHPEFTSDGFYFEDISELHENSKFEGGDILVIREDVLAIGLSERTTQQAVIQLVEKLKLKGDIKHVFTVILPQKRAMIHLDMVFTMLDHNFACIYEPVILGELNIGVTHIDISGKTNIFNSVPNLLAGLKMIGIEVEPIFCGGKNRINQEREQWMCGANFFALAPGKIIGYARSFNTFLELEKIANIPRIEAADVLNGKINLNDYDRYAIAFRGAELSRGGGGARCMTLPVLRI